MVPTLSCAFATDLESHEHARIAESLGYSRAYFYDSPALYPDVYVQMCRAAERTERISIGTGVAVPHLRHPMTTAAAIATLVALAGPERVVVGVGSGFTSRFAMGQKPVPWKRVHEWSLCVQALLRGEAVDWEGGLLEMLQTPGCAPARPIEVPWIMGAAGPKGIEVARQLGAGVFTTPEPIPGFDWSAVLTFGTVLDDGEDPGSDHAIEAGGHAAGVYVHYAAEHNMLDEMLPGIGRQWAAAYETVPAERRHLEMHRGHLVTVNGVDRPFISGDVLGAMNLAMDAAAWRKRLDSLEQAGATEIAYQPAGSDIPRELETFAAAFRAGRN